MSILTPAEKAQVKDDVRKIITSSGETVRILRPSIQDKGSFYGSKETGFSEIAESRPCEAKRLSPEDIRMTGHDLIMHVLPDTDVAEGDILEFEDSKYRVTDIVSHNCFGVVTHLELKLEKDRHG